MEAFITWQTFEKICISYFFHDKTFGSKRFGEQMHTLHMSAQQTTRFLDTNVPNFEVKGIWNVVRNFCTNGTVRYLLILCCVLFWTLLNLPRWLNFAFFPTISTLGSHYLYVIYFTTRCFTRNLTTFCLITERENHFPRFFVIETFFIFASILRIGHPCT